MTLEAWALFCLTETLLCLNPGPATLLVLSVALTRGQVAGLFASIGVLAANAVYFTLSASGLVAVHAVSAQAFRVIKWAGAAYLIWLGARMILRSFRTQPDAAPERPAVRASRSFWQGFTTQAANPNLLVYFAAILPQFVDSRQPLPGQVAHPRGQLLRDRARGPVDLRGARIPRRPARRAALPPHRGALRGRPADRGRRRARGAAPRLIASRPADRETSESRGGSRTFAIRFADMAAELLT